MALKVGKTLVILLSLYWSFRLLFYSPHWIFIDSANLLIHEAGHVLLSFLGQFMSVLGGTILQLLVPVLTVWYFLRSSQFFSAGFGMFWLGDSLINISQYISDARAMQLPLVNDGIHDWNWLLSTLHLLSWDGFLGGAVFILGALSIVSSFFVMSYFTYKN